MLADGPGLLTERLLVPGVVSLEVTALESHCHQVVAGASPSTGTLASFLLVAQTIRDYGSASSLCCSSAEGTRGASAKRKARAMTAFPILVEVRVKEQLCPGSGSRSLEAKPQPSGDTAGRIWVLSLLL